MGSFAGGGYAWIFPKGDDIANVGIGINDHKGGKAPIEYLNEFIEHSPLLDDAQAVELNVGGDPVGGLIENLYGDNILVCGDAAGQVDQVTGGGIILGMLGGRAAGIAAANAVRDNDCSKERLKEYEALYDEATFKAMPKIAVIKDLIDSFSDDDLNEIIEYFAALDLKGLSRSDAIKLFFKLYDAFKKPELQDFREEAERELADEKAQNEEDFDDFDEDMYLLPDACRHGCCCR